MKTKSILVMVLAALMLFSFTACEQKVPEFPYTGDDAKNVERILLSDESSVTFYAGKSVAENTVNTYIDIYRLDGSVSRDILAEVVIDGTEVKPGKNLATATWGDATDTSKQSSFGVMVNAISLTSVTGELEVAETGVVVGDNGTISGGITKQVFTGTYSDGTTVTLSADDLTKTVVNGVYTAVLSKDKNYAASDLTYTQAVKVAPATADKADAWYVWTEQEGVDIPEVGDVFDTDAYSVATITVPYNTSVSSVKNMIHVFAVNSDSGKIVAEVKDFVIHNLPAKSNFNEIDDSTKTGDKTYSYTVEASSLEALEGITTFTAKTGTVKVEDTLNLNSIVVSWAQTDPEKDDYYKAEVGTMPTATNFDVTKATLLSGADVHEKVSVTEVVWPKALYADQVGTSVTFTVTVSYGTSPNAVITNKNVDTARTVVAASSTGA